MWARRMAAGLISFQVLISAMNVATWDGVQALEVIDLNTEANVPTWFSTMLLTAIAGVATGLGFRARRDRRRALPWFLVTAGFLGLSLEEVAGIHERIGYHLGAADSVADWPLLYLPVMFVGAAVVVLAARDLPRSRALMAGTGLILFLGVLIAEVVSLWTGATLAATLLEENAEVLGEVMILVALATTLVDRIAPPSPRPARFTRHRPGAAGASTPERPDVLT